MSRAWVIGARGLLGAALQRALRQADGDVFEIEEAFSWSQREILLQQISKAVRRFSDAPSEATPWEIYWAAGIGSMSSTKDDLAAESDSLRHLLKEIEGNPSLMGRPGRLVFASSAGAIYAGATAGIISEATAVAPINPYGREKLLQEEQISAFCGRNENVSALMARISTLYGVGQAGKGRRQGLLSQLAKNTVRGVPTHIYVPLDTMRDYIDAEDASREMIDACRGLAPGSGSVVRIFSSECPLTISEVISIYRRLVKRQVRIVVASNELAQQYTRVVHFRSTFPSRGGRSRMTPVVGISRLLAAERLCHASQGTGIGKAP